MLPNERASRWMFRMRKRTTLVNYTCSCVIHFPLNSESYENTNLIDVMLDKQFHESNCCIVNSWGGFMVVLYWVLQWCKRHHGWHHLVCLHSKCLEIQGNEVSRIRARVKCLSYLQGNHHVVPTWYTMTYKWYLLVLEMICCLQFRSIHDKKIHAYTSPSNAKKNIVGLHVCIGLCDCSWIRLGTLGKPQARRYGWWKGPKRSLPRSRTTWAGAHRLQWLSAVAKCIGCVMCM